MKATSHAFVMVAESLAKADADSGIPDRHPTNTSNALVRRAGELGVEVGFNADGKYIRSVYTAVRWWMKMHGR